MSEAASKGAVRAAEVLVAGHLCLDIIPPFVGEATLEPGTLAVTGPALFAPGGAVANVGLSLRRLGVAARLAAAIGDDVFGAALRARLEAEDEGAAAGLRVTAAGATSYSVVINPPGRDRSFLHHPGLNDAYSAHDLERDLSEVPGVRLLHLGYPPLMRALYQDGGEALAAALARAKARGVSVSLDMAMPDLRAGVDWRAWLAQVLPHVDLFLPSLGETLRMLRGRAGVPEAELGARVPALGEELLALGAAVVGLKLGDRGLYLRSADAARLARGAPDARWAARELWAPVFCVRARGTTGAGDATIAGLLASLLRGLGPEEAMRVASAVGACSVEGADAVSGVRSWQATAARLQAPWRRGPGPTAANWREGPWGVWRGPADRRDGPARS